MTITLVPSHKEDRTMEKKPANVKAMTGNKAAAIGASLARPDLIAAYPITPQSSVVESLASMIANGELDSTMVQVESEHSAMSVVQGAAMAGGRTFTATSAQGLALMYEPYFRMSTLRLPMVMALATREMTSPETVWSGQQDAISVRDAGWMQVFVENNQEILDMVLQGYKIAENSDVLLPINVCYDGFYLSHLTERVEIPNNEDVHSFLPKYEQKHVILDPDNPMSVDPMTSADIYMEFRASHLQAMQKALTVIDEVDADFESQFGRSYGGAIDTYRCEDADYVLVTIGSMTGTAREAIDIARNNGMKVGLLKVRFLRPFPIEKVRNVLRNRKGFAVVDRSVCFGWNTGALYMEVKAAISELSEVVCNMSVIGGLGGKDISLKNLLYCIDVLVSASKTNVGQQKTLWI
jgi:pyruvate ferredoxin oxidoreductase alpha subunit/phenylglyoxylate dehydrogenase alpha subunit